MTVGLGDLVFVRYFAQVLRILVEEPRPGKADRQGPLGLA